MTRSGSRDTPRDARATLVSAAERLFAAQGIDGVSLREIMREAGQRNTTSLQYHFENRDGLLRAVLEKHESDVSTRRHAILDQIEVRGEGTLRDLASAFLLPLIPKLRDDHGGPEFLQIAAQLVNRTTEIIDPAEPTGALVYDSDGSLERWSLLVQPFLPPETVGPPLHRRFAVIRFGYIELGRRASVRTGTDDKLFASHLTDLISALLSAGVSDETRRYLGSAKNRKHSPMVHTRRH
ncbi:TetR/AcrR family transcriptional regulator [Nocardia salmonicida]